MVDGTQIESRVLKLADAIDWPNPSPEFSTRVIKGIESGASTRKGYRLRRAAIAMATVVVITGLLVFSPSARHAVADLFGAAGIRIGFTNDPAPAAGDDLNLGEPVQLVEVEQSVDFELRVPTGDDLGLPDGVYLGDDGEVTMVWTHRQTLPAASETNVGLLLAQRPVDEPRHIGDKAIGPGTEVIVLEVERHAAVWIEGAPHILTFLDNDNDPVEETTRLAANVLLWEINGVNHRLETTGDLESALAIVGTLEAMS